MDDLFRYIKIVDDCISRVDNKWSPCIETFRELIQNPISKALKNSAD
jgi:hypothetical protein